MMDSALPRDPLMPRRPKGMGAGLSLAILAHALLILAIAFGVNWRAHEPAGIEAELWSAVPQAAAPRAVAPEPQPQPTPPQVQPPPPPPPKAEEPPPKPAPDPQIAIEKAKREEQKKLEAQRLQEEQEQAKREKAKREEQKREEAKREKAEQEKQAKDEADRKKQAAADAAKQAAARNKQLERMAGLAGATGGETSTGTAMQSSGPSASYAGRIMARIKPNIVFTDIVDGNPTATVEVKLAPDGTIIGKRLLQSSGVKAWDDAVLRAVERTEVLPRDVDGRVPPPFPIVFRLRDAT
jgi:colicin import membrane protein